jgi:ribosomal protein S18 acetylase RimI-like enzyme
VPATVLIATTADAEELTDAFIGLIPQLSKSNPPPSLDAVRAMLAHEAIIQFVARDDDGRIVGVSTLAVFPIPTATRAWIEDVVVDAGSSGQGISYDLTNAMTAHARELGCKTVELTSRPSRAAANHVYQKLGFEIRDTNIYRFDLA